MIICLGGAARSLILALSLLLLWIPQSRGQDGLVVKPLKDYKLRVYVRAQLWSTYSRGMELYRDSLGYLPVDDRLNIYLRRARVGFKGEPLKGLKFHVQLSLDQTGKDNLSATMGTSQGFKPRIVLWDAFIQYRILPKSEGLYLTGGFFRPQFGRESITAAWAVSSMEKSMTQSYVRVHLVGASHGRTTGLNLGGNYSLNSGLHLNYNFGFFTPLHSATPLKPYSLSSVGASFSPLLVGRVVLRLGSPERDRYGLAYKYNFFGKRQGVSIGLAGSWQGQTDIFLASRSLGIDFMANLSRLHVDGELSILERTGQWPSTAINFDHRSYTGYIRAGYNIPLSGNTILEPVVMTMFFQGGTTREESQKAGLVLASSGRERTLDIGINWHLIPNKLSVISHYIRNDGQAGSAGEGSIVNNYFRQGGVGAIRRGDWWGLGVHASF